jgi:hypothetical protein
MGSKKCDQMVGKKCPILEKVAGTVIESQSAIIWCYELFPNELIPNVKIPKIKIPTNLVG